MRLPHLLQTSKFGFTYAVNVMASEYSVHCTGDLLSSLDEERTVRGSAVPVTSSLSDSWLSLISRNDVTLESANQSCWWINMNSFAWPATCLPPVLTALLRCRPLSLPLVFPVSLIIIILCISTPSLALSLSLAGLSPVVKGFWQGSRLMCVSLLIDSFH